MANRAISILLTALCLPAAAPSSLRADAWPTYRHDNRRSGVTGERLALPLARSWEYVGRERPRTAWAGPAKWNSYAAISNLKSMRNFDPVFYVTAARGCVFFGSSVDDAVHCLDLETGRERWTHFTNAPVRVPPSFHGGKLYFGSDDGWVYCITADSGRPVWQSCGAPTAGRIPVDGKLTALHPVRTGVLVQDGKAYFAASLLPWRKSWLCALDAETGKAESPGLFRRSYERMTAQGPMLASRTNLYVPQGRQTPLIFQRDDGEAVQSVGSSGFGGVFGLLTEDSMFIHGHGQNHRADGELRFFGDTPKKDLLVTFPRATSIVVHAGVVYLHADGHLQAFHRDKYVHLQGQIKELESRRKELEEKKKKLPETATEADRQSLDADIQSAVEQIARLTESLSSCFLWRVAVDCPLTLILAGDTLFAGGQDRVAAHEMATGRQVWTASVEGRAYGLAAVDGALLVSTDVGRITCFTGATEAASAR